MIDTVFGKFEPKRHVWQYLLSVSATHGTTSCGSHGFREDFKCCPIFSQKKRMTPGGMAILNTRSIDGRIYVGGYKT